MIIVMVRIQTIKCPYYGLLYVETGNCPAIRKVVKDNDKCLAASGFFTFLCVKLHNDKGFIMVVKL